MELFLYCLGSRWLKLRQERSCFLSVSLPPGGKMFRFWVKWPVRGSSETWSSKLTTNFSKYFFYSDSRRWCKGCTLKCKSCRWRRALWIDWCYENMEKQMELKVKPGPYIILKFHKCHPLNATFPATHQQKSLRIEFPYFLVWTKKNLSRKFRNLLF